MFATVVAVFAFGIWKFLARAAQIDTVDRGSAIFAGRRRASFRHERFLLLRKRWLENNRPGAIDRSLR
jgi:hypothetical protein